MIERNTKIMRPLLTTQVDQEEEERLSNVTNLTLGLYYTITKDAREAQVNYISNEEK